MFRNHSFIVLSILFMLSSLGVAADKNDLSTDGPFQKASKKHNIKTSDMRQVFGLPITEQIEKVRSFNRKDGSGHSRFRQKVRGVPVWGEEVTASHDASGKFTSFHGNIVKNLSAGVTSVTPKITADQALSAMKQKVINKYGKNKTVVFKNVKSELVVYLAGKTPKLSYAISFFADVSKLGEPSRPYYIVDANTGAILYEFEGLTHASTALLNLSALNLSPGILSSNFPVTVPPNQKYLVIQATGLTNQIQLLALKDTIITDFNRTTALCFTLRDVSTQTCYISNPAAGLWNLALYSGFAVNNFNLTVKTYDSGSYATGSGPGGNTKTGIINYGAANFAFNVLKDNNACFLLSDAVQTLDMRSGSSIGFVFSYIDQSATSSCLNSNRAVNGAFSPLNDAHFFGKVIYDMYNSWLGVSPLNFQIQMNVHYGINYENAFWDGLTMNFGDGATTFYPLVALDVASHEISHGFTEQHSGLIYAGQSGGINEAYSDIAGEAAEFYQRGLNDFKVAVDIIKAPTGSLRDMCNPISDGFSIASAKSYVPTLDVHYSSGIYNKAFCLLAKTPGWSTKTAFQAFALANQFIWTPSETFVSGARGVYDAACKLGLDTTAVVNAFAGVDIAVDTITNPCVPSTAVNTPPVVSMAGPAAGATVFGASVVLSANASDNLFVTGVEFFVDNLSVGKGTVAAGVYSLNWNSALVADGLHSVKAVATDNTGLSTTSAAVSINVNNNLLLALTVNKAGLGSGSILGGTINCGAVCSASVKVGTIVSLTATPAAGSFFTGWSGTAGCTGTGACSVTVDAVKNVIATFGLQYGLTVSKTGNGAITGGAINCGILCSANFNAGTSVTLVATPTAGNVLASWGGACLSTLGNTCVVSMNSAKVVSASFVPAFNLTVTLTNPTFGYISSVASGIICGSVCSASFAAQSKVTLTATPYAGRTFSSWGGACAGKTLTCVVTMSAAQSVKAAFK